MQMKTSAAGRQAIALREGVRLTAYQDTRKIWTIGVGHTTAAGPPAVRKGLVITVEECDAILARDLGGCEDAVNEAVKVPLSQNAFDACVSLAFNIGSPGFRGSSVVREINRNNMQAAAEDFMMWDKPPELVGRRSGEKAQFLRPDSVTAQTGAGAPAGSIAWVQTQLNEHGADPKLETDGDLGPATIAAIKVFQTAEGLKADGIAGPKTLTALGM